MAGVHAVLQFSSCSVIIRLLTACPICQHKNEDSSLVRLYMLVSSALFSCQVEDEISVAIFYRSQTRHLRDL